MLNSNSIEKQGNRLIKLKELEDRSARVLLIIIGILVIGVLVALFVFPIFSSFLYNEDDPTRAAEWWDNASSYVKHAWQIIMKPVFYIAGIAFLIVIAWLIYSSSYNSKMESTKQDPYIVQIAEYLLKQARSGNFGYHNGVKTILSDLGVTFAGNSWPAWRELSREEYKIISGTFQDITSFDMKQFPNITEPIPSFTYSIKNRDHTLTVNFQKHILQYFQQLVPKDAFIYVLDWQEDDEGYGGYDNGYKFYPHLSFKEWPVELLTAEKNYGTYHAFFNKDLTFGIFLNSDEDTICVFGEELINEVDKAKPLVFNTVLRIDGNQET